MERATEPMVDAPSEDVTCRRGSGRVGRKVGGALAPAEDTGIGGVRATAGQPSGEPARPEGRNPHGVESAPTADERSLTEPENLVLASAHPAQRGAQMTEATGDREDEGRSLHSSPRTGKPFAWRREAVDTAGRQEVDACPAR